MAPHIFEFSDPKSGEEPVCTKANWYSIIEPPPPEPLQDLFAGQSLGRLLDLLACFARSVLQGKPNYEDEHWLGGLRLLREFVIARSNHLWVERFLEAFEKIPGTDILVWAPNGIRNLVSRLRAMRAERWPFVPNTGVELLAIIGEIRGAKPQTGEVKILPHAGKKRVRGPKLTGTEEKIIGALRVHHNSSGEELKLEPVSRNALAKLAEVGDATVTRFFEKKTKGIENYKRLCTGREADLRYFLEYLDQPYPSHLHFNELKHKGSSDPNVDDKIDR